MIYRIFINDVTNKVEAVLYVENYLFESTLKAILKSINSSDPKRLTIEMVSKEN